MNSKDLKAYMEQKASECYQKHKQAFSNWKEGEIADIWIDKNGLLCIKYDSGNWWHYAEDGTWW